MNSIIVQLNELQSKKAGHTNTAEKINLGAVFTNDRNYIHEHNLFIANFNTIPNVIEEINIDSHRASAWLIEAYKSEIKDCYYNKRYYKGNKISKIDDLFYFIHEDLIVQFDNQNSYARFLFRKTDILKVEKVISEIKKFKHRKAPQPELSVLVQTRLGIKTNSLKISRPKLNLTDNYNDDFQEIHSIILKKLSKKNDKGLVLLHGKPGTGKTSYIRYLIGSLKKQVIFLPPNMAEAITNPDLISILIDNPNSVLVIEDAENIVVDREKDGGSPVSALLNISDGLLADCLNVQIICSFNTDISKIDSALMRKGRLIAKYEFKELEVEKARCLSQKLGFYSNIMEPMTLTAVYNQEEKDFQHIRKMNRIGFVA